MAKQLEIGKNYAALIGGLDAAVDRMTYLGGIKFEAYSAKKDKSLTIDSQGTHDKLVTYINVPSINMGSSK